MKRVCRSEMDWIPVQTFCLAILRAGTVFIFSIFSKVAAHWLLQHWATLVTIVNVVSQKKNGNLTTLMTLFAFVYRFRAEPLKQYNAKSSAEIKYEQRQCELWGCDTKSTLRRHQLEAPVAKNQNRQWLPLHQLTHRNQINPQGVALPSGILQHKWRAMHITGFARERERHKSTKQV